MINAIRQRYFTVHFRYENPSLRQRAQGLILMIWAAIAFIVLFIIGRAILTVVGMSSPALIVPPELVVGAIVLLATYALIQRGRLDAAIWTFIGLMLVPFVLATVISVDPAAPVILILPLIAAGMLLNRRNLTPILLIFIVTMILRAINQSGTTDPASYVPANNALSELVNYGVIFGLSAIFLLVFSGSSDQIAEGSFDEIKRLGIVSKFSSQLDNADEAYILSYLLEVVEDELGFGLAQIYLPDGDGNYTRRLRRGLAQVETGTEVLLRPSDQVVINEAALRHEAILVSSLDAQSRSEHLVPPARASLTLSLTYADQVFGVLDVQTERPEMFSDNTVAGMQTLADLTGREVALAQHIEELERNVRDQEAIINRFLNQMTELQRRSETATTMGWGRYLEGRGTSGFGFDYENGNIVSSSDLSDQIRTAIQQSDVYIEQKKNAQIVHVPITLREQLLGALTFTIPPDRAISERQTEMLRTVANRLGVALESNRLLEQTQAQAQRERKASDIGSLLLGETDIEALLDLAAENFNEALGAVHTRVYLEPGVFIGEAQP